MKFINFAIVKFSIFLALGIFIAYLEILPSFLFFRILIPLVFVLGIAWYAAQKQLFQNIFFGLITYLSFFSLGYISFQLRLPIFQKTHYSHFIDDINNNENSRDRYHVIQLKIKEVLKSDNYNTKYLAKIAGLNGKITSGKVLINLKKDSILTSYMIDDVLLVSATISDITPPLNPNQFNYAKYMRFLGVYHQIHLTRSDLLFQKRGTRSLRGKAEQIRSYITVKLRESPLKPNELSIIQALILGQRKDIDKKVYKEYAAAGTIHILAVSGLHVGIIYFFLLFLSSPLKHIPFGKLIQTSSIVLCLWLFAIMTGLSPSVVRAVTMFSFFAFAQSINRPTNTINTLFLSFFILLLINPLWLFHVGFQLSYLAVLFILWIQPVLYKSYLPKNYVIDKIWRICTVTLAAQLGVLPLSLYYFHQFPGLFLVSNIVIIPFLGLLLGGGILIVLLSVLNILPDAFASAYNFLIEILNLFISWIARQDSFLFKDIHFSSEKVFGTYLLIIAIILLWKKFNYQRFVFGLTSIAIIVVIFIWDKNKYSSNQLIVFHKSRESIIGYKQSQNLFLFQSDTIKKHQNDYPIKGYRVAQNIEDYFESKIPNIFNYNDTNILVLDSLGVFPKTSEIDIVLLTFSSKVNLKRLIDSLEPKLIIADGTNYRSYIKRWSNTCANNDIPFHYTGKNGSFTFN